MKGLFVIVLAGIIVAGGFMLASANKKDFRDVTIEVTGAPFRGAIGSGAAQRSVESVSSSTYTLSGKDSRGIFVASIFKTQEVGTLTVKLLGCPDGRVRSESTSAAYGGVTLQC